MDKAKLKRWSTIFRALANPNRLKIIKILSSGESLPVSMIARDIKISLKSTSKHLIMFKNLDILDAVRKQGRVFYSLNADVPADLRKTLALFL